jgi:hypothetical protein
MTFSTIRKASELFDSREEEFEFLEEYDYDVFRAQRLEEVGHKSDAAELHLTEGDGVDYVHGHY